MGNHAGVVTLDEDVLADLQELAARHGRSVRVIANAALRDFIRRENGLDEAMVPDEQSDGLGELESVRRRTTARLTSPTGDLDDE